MHPQPFSSRLFAFCVCLATLAVLVGCGTGTYKDRMNESIEVLEVQSPFLRTLSNEQVTVYNAAGYGVKLRRPQIFSDPEHTAHIGSYLPYRHEGMKSYAPKRSSVEATCFSPPGLMPSPAERGSWKSTWQAFEFLYVDPTDKAYPAYQYFAFVPAEEATTEQLQEDLLASLKSQFPEAEFAWEEVEVDDPAGHTTAWQHLTVKDTMAFDVRFWDFIDKDFYQPSEPLTNYPARLDFYVKQFDQPLMEGSEGSETAEEGDEPVRTFTAIVGVRAPNEIAEKFRVFQAVDASLGTLEPAVQVEDKSLATGDSEPGQQEEAGEEDETPSGPVMRPRGDREARRPRTPSPPTQEEEPPAEQQAQQPAQGVDPADTASNEEELTAELATGDEPNDFNAPLAEAGTGADPPPDLEQDEPVLLRWNLEEGARLNVSLSHESTGTLYKDEVVNGRRRTLEIDFLWEVTSLSTDGEGESHYEIESTIQDITYDSQPSDEDGFFTEPSEVSEDAMNTVYGLIDESFTLNLSNRGAIEDVNFPSSITSKLNEARGATKASFFRPDQLQSLLAAVVLSLPQGEERQGGQWNMTTTCDAWPLGAQTEILYEYIDHVPNPQGPRLVRLQAASLLDLELQEPASGGANLTLASKSASGEGQFDIVRGLLIQNQLTQAYSFTTGDDANCRVVWTTEISFSPAR